MHDYQAPKVLIPQLAYASTTAIRVIETATAEIANSSVNNADNSKSFFALPLIEIAHHYLVLSHSNAGQGFKQDQSVVGIHHHRFITRKHITVGVKPASRLNGTSRFNISKIN